jgi:hypothetical protein
LRKIQKILGHVRLETTTIYVKVARPVDDEVVISPLDVLSKKQATASAKRSPTSPSVGSLRIHLKSEPDDRPESRHAKVTLEIRTQVRPVYLTGIVAREVRRGWINLDIPPLEQWEGALSWLSRRQRERMEEPAFYELLQREIPRRLLRPPNT